MVGAFVAQYHENGKPKSLRNDTMPWVLFCGGMILILVGSREMKNNHNEKK